LPTFPSNFLKQTLVHSYFFPVHHSAELVLPNQMGIVAWLRLLHLLLQHARIIQQILLPLSHSLLLLALGKSVLLFELLDVHFLLFKVSLAFALLLVYLVGK